MRSATTLAIVLLLCNGALAHDWYSGKKNGNGEYCCGVLDCKAIPASSVRTLKDGYQVGGYSIPYEQALPAEDGGYSICVVHGKPICFFAPPMGE